MSFEKINIEQFVKDYEQGMTDNSMAEKYGRTPRTIRNYIAKLRLRGEIKYRDDRKRKKRGETTKTHVSESDLVTQPELLKLFALYQDKKEVAKRLGISVNKLTHMCRELGVVSTKEKTEMFIKHLDSALDAIPAYNVMPRDKDIAPEHVAIQFTDWHAGKKVIRANDKITFDIDVFNKRVDLMLEKTLYLLQHHVKFGTDIGMIDILNTGDLADGENIYEGQSHHQIAAPPDQVMLVVEAQIRFIEALRKEGYPVKVHCVKGNHGRGAKGSAPSTNWDVMIYKILDFWQRRMEVSGVEINYTESDYYNVNINGWKYHLRHIAFEQGDTSAGRSKFHGWGAMHECDALVYGHWHHWGAFPVDHLRVFRGGSLVGPDEFSDKLGKSSEPIQLIWGVPKNRVSSFLYPVDLRG
jgi:predicted phosphodiesterase/DNA-binding CsgD family transcriptional regulator